MGMGREATRRSPASVALLTLAALALAAGGCGASKFTHCNTAASDFQQQVLQAPKPVLVEFYKAGCPTCGLLEPTLDQLADEYAGQLAFVSFELMTPYFAVTCPEVQKRQRIAYYPTIILYVNGVERKRWILDYSINNYRVALNETVGGPTQKEPDESKEPKEPKAAAAVPEASKAAGAPARS
jgi:thioredoxin 1